MRIIICGDSTAACYDPRETCMRGWGQALCDLLPGADIRNHAMAGRSTGTFLREGRLARAAADLEKGSLMLIQFGHNDENLEKPERYVEPEQAYPANLEIFVNAAREREALPVLMTPICIRNWQEGVHQGSHGIYPEKVRQTARRLQVPCVDLYEDSLRVVEALGEEKSSGLFMNLAPGEDPRFPEGKTDNAHTREAGARAFAELTARRLRELGLVL